jgi:glucose/arabinose dehydrogenase
VTDADGDGVAESRGVFLSGLNQPFGMLVLGDSFYVANTNGVLRYPYKAGQEKIEGQGEKVLDLPGEGYNNHWTRNLYASKDGKKLYVTVGSASNVDEKLDRDAKDPRRAAILECDPDGKNMRVFASGLRNPNGLAWEPVTGALWTAVNERDALGDDLVPDYITSVKDGAFYGWPYAYFGRNEDPRHKGRRPDLVQKSVKPDFALGSHTACLGLVFYTADAFPEKFRGGAYVAQRGSWNRSEFSGYRVLYVPFKDGKPTGEAMDFLGGFIADESKKQVYGRPVGLAVTKDGAMVVTDDAANTVWRVSAEKAGVK